jgi:hypothetical protein
VLVVVPQNRCGRRNASLVLSQTALDAGEYVVLPVYAVQTLLAQSDERFGPQLFECCAKFEALESMLAFCDLIVLVY